MRGYLLAPPTGTNPVMSTCQSHSGQVDGILVSSKHLFAKVLIESRPQVSKQRAEFNGVSWSCWHFSGLRWLSGGQTIKSFPTTDPLEIFYLYARLVRISGLKQHWGGE